MNVEHRIKNGRTERPTFDVLRSSSFYFQSLVTYRIFPTVKRQQLVQMILAHLSACPDSIHDLLLAVINGQILLASGIVGGKGVELRFR